MQSLAPTPLRETRSLDGYVRDAEVLSPTIAQPDDPRRYNPGLNRGQKLFWGTLGMVVHSVCDSDSKNTDLTKPDPLLDSRERACIECNRVGRRAVDAIFEGLFPSGS